MYPKLKAKKREPNGSLLSLCSPIESIEEIRPFLVSLARMVVRDKLEGLSANQVGVAKQVFITDVPGDCIRFFINPIVTIVDHEQSPIHESCASRRITVERYRHAHVFIDALNMKGQRFIIDTSSPVIPADVGLRLSARIQHEMEHMLGICTKTEPDVSSEQMALADWLLLPAHDPVRDQQPVHIETIWPLGP